jgi:hypothetical protein
VRRWTQWTAWAGLAIHLLTSVATDAATHTAPSAALADVQATHDNDCAHGDTLAIPNGDVTWAGTFAVTKAIQIVGAGTNSGATLTRVRKNTGDIISFASASISNRSIGVYALDLGFDNYQTSTDERAIVFIRPANRNTLITNFRVSRCKFTFGQRVINGTGYGVIDHCHFANANGELHSRFDVTDDPLDDMGGTEWALGVRLGTTNTWVIEDCAFVLDSGEASNRNQETLYGQYASRYIFRHNVVTQSIAGSYTFVFADAHGRTRTEDWRGSHAYEIYSNTIYWAAANTFRVCNLRGGTMLLYSNIFRGPLGQSTNLIQLKDEGLSTAGIISTNDWVTNSHFYAQSWSSESNPTNLISIETSPDSSPYVILNANYFLRAHQAGDNDHPYTQLVYPHPRVALEDGLLAPVPVEVGILRGPVELRGAAHFR